MRTAIALAGVLLFAIALLVEAPATLVDSRLDTVSGGRLRVIDARGTVWNGTGMLWLSPAFVSPRLRWHLEPWALLGGKLRGSVSAEDGAEPRARFSLGGKDFALSDVALAVPADALLHVARAPEPLTAAGGMLGVRAEALTWRHDAYAGSLGVRWDGASLPAPTSQGRIALGDLRLDAVGEGGALNGTLANTGGDVDISGKARLATDALRVEMAIRPRDGIDPERSRAIASALAFLGQPDGQNGYRLAWTESLR